MQTMRLVVTNLLLFFISLTASATTPDFSLVGFGRAATGGEGGRVVTAHNYHELKLYAESDSTYIILIQDTIRNGADGGSVRVRSNKSILGVGDKALLFGVGLTIRNNYHNVIVRNLRITMMGVTTRTDKPGVYSSTGDEGRPQILTNGGDCIRLLDNSHTVWIDHCELYSENPDIQTNIDLYDGLIDITGGSHNITISWNYIHNHHKTHLVGSSETDTLNRRITFHHNFFYNCRDRLPFYRAGEGHVFNNYYLNCRNAVNSLLNACLFVESNYFENVSKSTVFSSVSTARGYALLKNNLFINSAVPTVSTCNRFVPAEVYDYEHVLTPVNEVKQRVTQWAGVGKINPLTSVKSARFDDFSFYRDGDYLNLNSKDNHKLQVVSLSGVVLSENEGNRVYTGNLSGGIYLLKVDEYKLLKFYID
jgi:pectate lyase